MSSWDEKRNKCIRKLIELFRQIDEFNACGGEGKIEDVNMILDQIVLDYGVTRNTAKEWYKEAEMLNKNYHDSLLQVEKYRRARGIVVEYNPPPKEKRQSNEEFWEEYNTWIHTGSPPLTEEDMKTNGSAIDWNKELEKARERDERRKKYTNT